MPRTDLELHQERLQRSRPIELAWFHRCRSVSQQATDTLQQIRHRICRSVRLFSVARSHRLRIIEVDISQQTAPVRRHLHRRSPRGRRRRLGRRADVARHRVLDRVFVVSQEHSRLILAVVDWQEKLRTPLLVPVSRKPPLSSPGSREEFELARSSSSRVARRSASTSDGLAIVPVCQGPLVSVRIVHMADRIIKRSTSTFFHLTIS